MGPGDCRQRGADTRFVPVGSGHGLLCLDLDMQESLPIGATGKGMGERTGKHTSSLVGKPVRAGCCLRESSVCKVHSMCL